MKDTLGINEALLLSALENRPASSIADLARALTEAHVGRSIDDGTIYMALRRMCERGFVSQERRSVVSADQRTREIGLYTVTPAGSQAAARFASDVAALPRLTAVRRL